MAFTVQWVAHNNFYESFIDLDNATQAEKDRIEKLFAIIKTMRSELQVAQLGTNEKIIKRFECHSAANAFLITSILKEGELGEEFDEETGTNITKITNLAKLKSKIPERIGDKEIIDLLTINRAPLEFSEQPGNFPWVSKPLTKYQKRELLWAATRKSGTENEILINFGPDGIVECIYQIREDGEVVLKVKYQTAILLLNRKFFFDKKAENQPMARLLWQALPKDPPSIYHFKFEFDTTKPDDKASYEAFGTLTPLLQEQNIKQPDQYVIVRDGDKRTLLINDKDTALVINDFLNQKLVPVSDAAIKRKEEEKKFEDSNKVSKETQDRILAEYKANKEGGGTQPAPEPAKPQIPLQWKKVKGGYEARLTEDQRRADYSLFDANNVAVRQKERVDRNDIQERTEGTVKILFVKDEETAKKYNKLFDYAFSKAEPAPAATAVSHESSAVRPPSPPQKMGGILGGLLNFSSRKSPPKQHPPQEIKPFSRNDFNEDIYNAAQWKIGKTAAISRTQNIGIEDFFRTIPTQKYNPLYIASALFDFIILEREYENDKTPETDQSLTIISVRSILRKDDVREYLGTHQAEIKKELQGMGHNKNSYTYFKMEEYLDNVVKAAPAARPPTPR